MSTPEQTPPSSSPDSATPRDEHAAQRDVVASATGDTPPAQDGATAEGVAAGEQIDALREALSALGAETPGERRAKRIIPWMTSAAVHAGLIVMGFLAFTATQMLSDDDPVVVTADFQQLRYDPLVATSDISPEEALADETPQPSDATQDLANRLDRLQVDPLTLFSDAATSAPTAEFTPQPRSGTVRFAGLTGTNARRIAFVVDASGSMIGAFHIILEELGRSIENLSAEQEFIVVFFQRSDVLTPPPGNRLLRPTRDEQIRVLTWARETIIPQGRSNPIRAFEHALSLRPDLVFLLSNDITGAGEFEIDQRDLLSLLDRLNPIDPATGLRRTQIQCIQFLDPDPLDTLRRIAEAHSGPQGYKFITRRELGLTAP